MATHHVRPASAAVAVAAEERSPSWGILEAFAYFADVQNATVAVSKTPDNKHIQISFRARAPPLLSSFCIHSPDGADMDHEPYIVAMEDDIALLRVDSGRCSYRDYYVYQADDGSGKPSLTLLPRTPNNLRFQPTDIGLLRRPGKDYLVAGFSFIPSGLPYGGLTLSVYDSKRKNWKIHALSLSVQGCHELADKIFVHKNCKVVTVGGDAGTMAFVDLWRGVLLCDVLTLECEAAGQWTDEAIPFLDYVPLPDDLRRTAKVKGDARLFRDIAFLDNHLKCVDLGSRSLWIRPATTSGAWSQQYMIRSFKEIESNNSRVNLLPGHRSFNGLLVCRPVVELHHDDAKVLYFMVKMHQNDLKGSMLAVDLLTKKILGVAPFISRSNMIYDFNYMHTRLFKHLSAAKTSLNQSRMLFPGSARKMKRKAQEQIDGAKATLNQEGSSIKMNDEAEKQLDGESVAEDGDAMALD